MESSALLLFSSNTIYIFVTCALVSVLVLLCEINYGFLIGIQQKTDKKNNLKNPAPGPRGLPIIGNLQEMDGYEVPYQAFGELAKRFGPIIRLQLGSIPTIVVNGIENIKEVLIHRGTHFDSRPNFRRYHQLFAGDKENSLAFCDWSDVQKARRDMLIPHTFPRNFSQRFDKLNDIVFDQMHTMVGDLKLRSVGEVEIKPVLLETCANIFTQFFASKNFENSDVKFQKMIKSFDKIFYEVNQGYAADFLPFLLPLHQRNFKRLENWSHGIRDFILENIVEDRFETKTDEYEEDYVDSLINHVKNDVKPSIEWDTALFALEDIIGGHSAVGNFLVKVFGFIVQNPNVQIKIQEEIDLTLNDRTTGSLTLGDRSKMVYTEAVIMECLRLIASPIVPHVANQDSTIAGYDVKKDDLIFLNNYDLSMSTEFWDKPEEFQPERFLKSGRLIKPDHFLPFGAGRRSCMGYKMVQILSFSILSSIMQQFTVLPLENQNYKVSVGSLAVPEDSYKFKFVTRN